MSIRPQEGAEIVLCLKTADSVFAHNFNGYKSTDFHNFDRRIPYEKFVGCIITHLTGFSAKYSLSRHTILHLSALDRWKACRKPLFAAQE